MLTPKVPMSRVVVIFCSARQLAKASLGLTPLFTQVD